MKPALFTLLTLLLLVPTFAQEPSVNTSGDNSPAVIARSFSVTYGVRADAVEAILWIYDAEGYDAARRDRATEQIIRDYAQSPERQQQADVLSEAIRSSINNPQVASALEWDLFARSHYLSTTGLNSPAVVAGGDVNIWYGIPPKALRALAEVLEKNKVDLSNFETLLSDQVKKYEELKAELQTYGAKEEIYRQAETLLEEGRLEEAEQLIESDFDASMKRQAYKGYVYGKTKELLLKYEEAAKGYKNAIQNDEGNSIYHLYYADNENTLARYDQAIRHYEIALGIDILKIDKEKQIATLFNNLGEVWRGKGEYDKAIEYYEKALQIDLRAYGENHASVATRYNNLGAAWRAKGEYDKAIEYFEKAIQIFLKVLDENHPSLAFNYNNLGEVWQAKVEYDKATEYFGKALQIFSKAFGENHPNIAIVYNNLGKLWQTKGEYDKAAEYFGKALQIFSKALGENHPYVAIGYNNLGEAWQKKGEYDKATEYFGKALQINLKALGENHPSIAPNYNNLGEAWRSKGEYDKAIEYFGKALQINLKTLGESHPEVATGYNNLGSAYLGKREYDKAIDYFEKIQQIYLEAFGESHPNIAMVYNNLGSVWYSREEYDKAIDCFEKALQIYLKVWGENHPSVATGYNNLGSAWRAKGEYDKAIKYYEQSQIIWGVFLEPSHPNQKTVAGSLSQAENSRGLDLLSEKNYQEALGYFQKALKNAQWAGADAFSLNCLNNIGSSQKRLQQYEAGLESLEAGLQLAARLNQALDQQIKEQVTPEMLVTPEVQAKIAELKNPALIRRMQYHKVGCLKGLNRGKEAKALAKQLWQEGLETNDTRLLEDLKREGYDFGG